eukprot:scaffold28492_cov50-Attheya_sp.AAC.2
MVSLEGKVQKVYTNDKIALLLLAIGMVLVNLVWKSPSSIQNVNGGQMDYLYSQNKRHSMVGWYPDLKNCNGQGLKYAAYSKASKVGTVNAVKIAKGGWDLIPQGSGGMRHSGAFCMKISQIQHESGLFGTVAELGVHYGRFTSALFITARKTEKLVVADVFEQQDKNIDGSGHGNKEGFMKGLEVYGLTEKDLHTIYTGSTDELKNNWSQEAGFEQFRFISVDAGHTAILTRNDLLISTCNLLKGGVVVLDDLFHFHWPGVTEGMFQFFNTMDDQHQLYPFLLCDEKLFMTNDRDFHGKYYNVLKHDPLFSPLLVESAAKVGGSNEFEFNGVPYLKCIHVNDIDEIWASTVY